MPHTNTPPPTIHPSLKLVVGTLIAALGALTTQQVAAQQIEGYSGVVIDTGGTAKQRRAHVPAEALQVTGYSAGQLGAGAILLSETRASSGRATPKASADDAPQVRKNSCRIAKVRKVLANIKQRIGRTPHCTPNYALNAIATPNDTHYSLQYGAGLMSLPAAWDITTGSSSVIAVVIDTGIDYNHPDIAPNMWVNPSEIAGNGIDDDNNGYIDDINGINAITNSGNPFDDNGHGTHVAGIIGARGNNGVGVAGAAWNVKLVGAKFLSSSGSGSLSNAIKAITYANNLRRAGHRVIVSNNSWGGGGFSTALFNAIKDSEDLGILFVAAAGNSTNNNDLAPSYPASYTNNNVISVASVTSTGALSSFSNYGATSVDIAAPGSSIASTYPNNQYVYLSGTSMASPQVAGVVTLLQSTCNGNLSISQMRNALLTTGTQYPGLTGKVASGAIVNAFGAVKAAQSSCALNSTPTPDPLPTTEPTPTATATSTSTPSPVPSGVPTAEPTAQPTAQPTSQPSPEPSSTPAQPTAAPTDSPTSTPVPPEPTSTPTPLPTSTPTPTATPTPLPLLMSIAPSVNVQPGARFTVSIANLSNVPLQPVSLSLLDPKGRNYTCGSLTFPVKASTASATFILPVTARYFNSMTFAAQSQGRSTQSSLTVWRPLKVTNRALQQELANVTCQVMKRSVRRLAAQANR